MQAHGILIVGAVAVSMLASLAHAKVNVVVVHNDNEASDREFKPRVIAAPAADDAAAKAKLSIVDGRRDSNGGELAVLQDGRVPTESDEPSENFFFAAGSPGGVRIR